MSKCQTCHAPAKHYPPDGDFRYVPPLPPSRGDQSLLIHLRQDNIQLAMHLQNMVEAYETHQSEPLIAMYEGAKNYLDDRSDVRTPSEQDTK